jgi:glycosyltransferase involved in cell wall biosynthesis
MEVEPAEQEGSSPVSDSIGLIAERTGSHDQGEPPRILMVSTYPPTRCGIATFTHSLVEALSRLRGGSDGLAVARLMGRDDVVVPAAGVELVAAVDCPTWPAAVARVSSHFDVVWIQHEFGIFGCHGPDAIEDLFRLVDKPIVSTFHTVLRCPSPEQRSVMDQLLAGSDTAVALSNVAGNRLVEVYGADPHDVRVIPHGAGQYREKGKPAREQPRVLTWGLLGPGKGIEWGIRAMARLDSLHPRPHYVVAGATHPSVLRSQGTAYRRNLERLATDLGIREMVSLQDFYITPERLEELLGSAQIVLLPYDSSEQVSSGVLVEAIGAGKAVVATGFPHAVELLSEGAGTLVEHRDPEAIAAALEHYLTNPDALRAAEEAAARLRRQHLWPSVAQRCESVARDAASHGLSWKERGSPVTATRRPGVLSAARAATTP